MIKVIHTLAPENGMAMDEIASFETENYFGMYDQYNDEWLLIAKEDVAFNAGHLDYTNTLDELDSMVYNATCGEHIIGVSRKNKYKLILVDD